MAWPDVHFYAMVAIAKAAGYSDEDAKLLVWANMETDHTLQVQWYNCAWSNLGLYFHFWPGDPKTLICRPDSELSKRIMDRPSRIPGLTLPSELTLDKEYWLCVIAIALHGLQDTYFHQGWVGKFNKHNCLPVWAHEKLTLTLGPPYGHSPLFKLPDVANATYTDPRTNETIINKNRVFDAITATGEVLGITTSPEIYQIFADVKEYEVRKQKLRDLAGMPDLRFSDIRGAMLKKYGREFRAAAKAQAKIVKAYLKGE